MAGQWKPPHTERTNKQRIHLPDLDMTQGKQDRQNHSGQGDEAIGNDHGEAPAPAIYQGAGEWAKDNLGQQPNQRGGRQDRG